MVIFAPKLAITRRWYRNLPVVSYIPPFPPVLWFWVRFWVQFDRCIVSLFKLGQESSIVLHFTVLVTFFKTYVCVLPLITMVAIRGVVGYWKWFTFHEDVWSEAGDMSYAWGWKPTNPFNPEVINNCYWPGKGGTPILTVAFMLFCALFLFHLHNFYC